MLRFQRIPGLTAGLTCHSVTLVRAITDQPYYEWTDNTHLHLVDSQSTKRKFHLKLKKMAKDQKAVERRLNHPKKVLKPWELPEVELPEYVERGPSDILRYAPCWIDAAGTSLYFNFQSNGFLSDTR